MAEANAVLANYGPDATVAVDLRCPRFGCGGEAKGTAVVVNEYGVRDPLPKRCRCGVLYRVERIVDIEAEAVRVGGSR